MTDSLKTLPPGSGAKTRTGAGSQTPGKKSRTGGLERRDERKADGEPADAEFVEYQHGMLPPKDDGEPPPVPTEAAVGTIRGPTGDDELVAVRDMILQAQRDSPLPFEPFWARLTSMYSNLGEPSRGRLATEKAWCELVYGLGFELGSNMASDPELKRRILRLFARGVDE